MELHFGLFISSSSLLTIPSLLKPFWLQGSESGGVVATLRTKRSYHHHYEVSPPLSVGATLTSHYSSATPGMERDGHRAEALAGAGEEDAARGRAAQESARGRAARGGANDEPHVDGWLEEAARGRAAQESARGRAVGGPGRAAAAEPRLGHPQAEDGWRFGDGYQRLVVDEAGVPQCELKIRDARRWLVSIASARCLAAAWGQNQVREVIHRGRSTLV